MVAAPSCNKDETTLLTTAYENLLKEINYAVGANNPACIWRCMREFLDPNDHVNQMTVKCRDLGKDYGECSPRLNPREIIIGDYAFDFGHNSPNTSVAFVVCHELMHQCRHQCGTEDNDRKKDEDMTNSLCEWALPGQRPVR